MGVHFVDEAVILVRSGKGGAGCVSFRREKFVPRGGPDGGDGGRGGHVVLQSNPQLTSLFDLGHRHIYAAENGRPGGAKNCSGRNGADLLIGLPVGTQVSDRRTGDLLADLDRVDSSILVARGGAGGRGNKAFATATHQTPRECERGEDGVERELSLVLKLMADVGLVGLPNAGKSTLLSRVSAAHPRIADYPFTTLAPQLGIAVLDGERRLTFADIPGLIEGAHTGLGLGTEFLRHLERTRVLVHLLDPFERTVEDLVRDYRIIREELRLFSARLVERRVLTAIGKIDLIAEERRGALVAALSRAIGEPVLALSAVTGAGLSDLLEAAWSAVRACNSPPSE